jgi:hypothetical protein
MRTYDIAIDLAERFEITENLTPRPGIREQNLPTAGIGSV